MAYTKILMSNGVEIKTAPIGFSWTTFFWGGWPAIIRQDWLIGIVVVILGMLTYGVIGIIFAFFYNKIYVKSLFDKGYWVHSMSPDLSDYKLKEYLGYAELPKKDRS